MTKTAVFFLLLGAGTFVGGVAMLSVAVAVMVAGALLVTAGVLSLETRKPEGDR